jgi:hypothetical protein
MDQFVPMFIMTEVDIVLLIYITRAEPFGLLKIPGAILLLFCFVKKAANWQPFIERMHPLAYVHLFTKFFHFAI